MPARSRPVTRALALRLRATSKKRVLMSCARPIDASHTAGGLRRPHGTTGAELLLCVRMACSSSTLYLMASMYSAERSVRICAQHRGPLGWAVWCSPVTV